VTPVKATQPFYDVALGGKVPANACGFQAAFMTNAPSPNAYEAALGAQIKPEWARFTDGVPTPMVRIPRRALQNVSGLCCLNRVSVG